MGIMDNEGHDPMGFGNVRPAQSADRAEIKRLQAGWDQAFRIGVAAQEDNARLRAALETSSCPRPANGAPDFLTVSECMARGECGCDSGAALGFTGEQAQDRKP